MSPGGRLAGRNCVGCRKASGHQATVEDDGERELQEAGQQEHGRLKNGKATLTMTVLRPMTKGRYTVSMVITDATIKAKKVLNLG